MIDYVLIPEERKNILKKDKKWKKIIEKLSNVKVEINDSIKIISDDPLECLRAKEVFKAFGRGFDFNTSLNLLDEDYFLDIIRVDDFSGKSRNRRIELKGRVIGSKGKTKKLIEKYTNTKISVYGKTISIIGKGSDIKKAKEAIEMLLSGAMHKTVYRFLEKVGRNE